MHRFLYITTILFLATVMFTACQNQQKQGFTIKGEVSGFEDSTKLYLKDLQKEKTVDSSYVTEGTFQFTGKVKEPSKMMISSRPEKNIRPKHTSLWVENSRIIIKGKASDFKHASITGSRQQEVANILKERVRPYQRKRDSLVQVWRKMRKEGASREKQKRIWEKIHPLDSARSVARMEFIKEHINSYPALYHLNFKKYKMPKDSLASLFETLNPKYKESSYGKILSTYLDLKHAQVGEKYIDFTAQTMDGDTFRLSDIDEKYIILQFWSPGCGFCRKANKHFADTYSTFKDSVEIVSFALSKNKQHIVDAAKKDSIHWPLASTFKGMEGKTALQYNVQGVPAFYIIAPSGKIIDKVVGFSKERYQAIMKTIGNHKI